MSQEVNVDLIMRNSKVILNTGQYYLTLNAGNLTANRSIYFPDTDDILVGAASLSGMAGGSSFILNSLSGTSQLLIASSSGTDFNISSVGSGHTFNIPTAGANIRGLLSSGNWNLFNNKLSNNLPIGQIFIGNGSNEASGVLVSGDAIIGLDGNLTLSTVNSNVGTYPFSTITVNSKGLVTAISSGDISVSFTSGNSVIPKTTGNTLHPSFMPISVEQITNRTYSTVTTPAATTLVSYGLANPTATAGFSANRDSAVNPKIRYSTALGSGSTISLVHPNTHYRRSWDANGYVRFAAPPNMSISGVPLLFVGFSNAALSTTVNHNTNCAVLRYSAFDVSGFWSTYTNDGNVTGPFITSGQIPIVTGANYLLNIQCSSGDVKYYLNNTLIHTALSGLPIYNTGLRLGFWMTNPTGSYSLDFSYIRGIVRG